jgi:hypothetical protein
LPGIDQIFEKIRSKTMNRATNREEAPTTKSKKNLTKSKRFVLKLRTDQIHLGTNLSPKIHRLGSKLSTKIGKMKNTWNENHSFIR